MKGKKINYIKSFKKFTIWIILFFGGVLFSLFFNDISFSVISSDLQDNQISSLKNKQLEPKKSIDFNFIADKPNLGIITVRFQEPNKKLPFEDQGTINYTLIDNLSGAFLYNANFKTGLLYDRPYLPLGVPIQTNSLNKSYKLRLVYVNGNASEIIKISDIKPILATSFQFTRADIFSFDFLIEKILNGFRNLYTGLYTLSFILPFIIYILWQRYKDNKNLFYIYLSIFSFFILFDIFFIPEINLLLQIQLAIVWLTIMKLNNTDSIFSFRLYFITFGIAFILLFIGKEMTVFFSKVHYWNYVFLLFGIFFSIYEEFKSNKKYKKKQKV